MNLEHPLPTGNLPPAPFPDLAPRDLVETAVVTRLAASWARRATVKRNEPDLDDQFDLTKQDYPEQLLPFVDHDVFRSLDRHHRDRVLAWGWIAFNKNIMDIEQYVVNPGFDALANDAFDIGTGDSLTTAIRQAMVDEQYHTLMHLNASAVTRRRRGWTLPDRALPEVLTVRRRTDSLQDARDPRHSLIRNVAFMTVAEVSISAYLDLITDNEDIQPVNRATVALHARDEYAHASIADELAGLVIDVLTVQERHYFLDGLVEAMKAFSASDFRTWQRIVDLEQIVGGESMIDDAEHDRGHHTLVQDFRGVHTLCRKLGVEGSVEFDWS